MQHTKEQTKTMHNNWLAELKSAMIMKPTELTHQITMAVIDPKWMGTMEPWEQEASKNFNKSLHKMLVENDNLYRVRAVLKRDLGVNNIAAEDDFINSVLNGYLKAKPNESWIGCEPRDPEIER